MERGREGEREKGDLPWYGEREGEREKGDLPWYGREREREREGREIHCCVIILQVHILGGQGMLFS